MTYSWAEDTWVSRDITFVSEHMTEDDTITEIRFAQNPDNLLFCRASTGGLLVATYERGNDIIGWTRFTVTGFSPGQQYLFSICPALLGGTDYVLGAFQRDVNTDFTLEVYDTTLHFDSAIKAVNFPADTAIVGITHLAGKTISVKLDGANHPDVTLDGSGNGTLQWPGEQIQLGINYTAYLKTLPLGNIIAQGLTTVVSKKWNSVYVKIYNSAYPKINGTRPAVRSGSMAMDTAVPLTTEDIKITNLGWDRAGQIEIEQDLPFDTNIAGIFGETIEDIL
jgi:hypothetical protein